MALMTNPTEICEQVLRDRKASNIDANILPSENVVIDRLLERRPELVEAYAEIHRKLSAHPRGIENLLDIVLQMAVFWSPDRIAKAREAHKRLEEIKRKIAEVAQDLAGLMEECSELNSRFGFESNTDHHIVDLIGEASHENGYYHSYLKKELESLTYRFDLKYWPSPAKIVQIIGQKSDVPVIEVIDPLTRAATTGARGSKADFFKALFRFLEESSVRNHGYLPCGFKLRDDTLASLANCALDLGADDLVDGNYVKGVRQKERERNARETGD